MSAKFFPFPVPVERLAAGFRDFLGDAVDDLKVRLK
jgi:hypothetical protein